MRHLFFAAMAALALSSGAQAATILNGSFEEGSDPGSFSTPGTGSVPITAIDNWTIGGAGVDYIGSYWTAADGVRSIDLSAGSTGSLSQTFATTPNQAYLVTFSIAGNPAGNPVDKSLSVLATGGVTQNYGFTTVLGNSTLTNMGWLEKTYAFTASGASTTLLFSSLDATPYGPALDDVSISAVPEPATWGMMILGFGFIGAFMRRRSQQKLALA